MLEYGYEHAPFDVVKSLVVFETSAVLAESCETK